MTVSTQTSTTENCHGQIQRVKFFVIQFFNAFVFHLGYKFNNITSADIQTNSKIVSDVAFIQEFSK